MVIASPSQETANTILDTTEKITTALDEYKRLKKQREAKDVINPPPMSYVFPPPQVPYPQHQPAMSSQPAVHNPFLGPSMAAPLYNPFMTASPTTMATTTSPSLPFATTTVTTTNPFPSSPVQVANSNLSTTTAHANANANYSPPNANQHVFVTNPFLVSPQHQSANNSNGNAFTSSPLMSAGFNANSNSNPALVYPGSPYSPPTNPSAQNANFSPPSGQHNPFPNGNPYDSPSSITTSPSVNPYPSHQ